MPKLIEVIEFLDDLGTTMVYRFPPDGECEIKWGAQLTVRESQSAVFFRDGKALDVFGPGRHVLQTQNIPILTKAITSLGYGAESPFRAEVYFCNLKVFRNMKWGTKEPIVFRDSQLQMVRLRSHGIFSTRINDSQLFVNKIVGTENLFTFDKIEGYLRNIIVSRLTDILGETLTSIFDLPRNYDELSIAAKSRVTDDFDRNGLELVDFFITSITLPPETQAVIDEKAGMNAIGNMNTYLQFKAAKAMEKASEQPGGVAGAGVGLGAGIGMGAAIPQMLKESMKEDSNSKSGVPQEKVDADDPAVKIKKLKELLDIGAITQEEFETKKKSLLEKI